MNLKLMIVKIRKYLVLFAISLSFIMFSPYIVQGTEQPEIFRSPTSYHLPPQANGSYLVAANHAPSFAIPIDCTLGENCFIMQSIAILAQQPLILVVVGKPTIPTKAPILASRINK